MPWAWKRPDATTTTARSTRSAPSAANSIALHPAERATDDACRRSMPRRSSRRRLAATRSRTVRAGNRSIPARAVGRGRAGAGRAVAGTDGIRADDEVAVGVDRRARADERLPPASAIAGDVRVTGCVRVAGQGVEDEDDVVTGGIESPPRLVGECRHRAIGVAAVSDERLVKPSNDDTMLGGAWSPGVTFTQGVAQRIAAIQIA